MNKQKKSIKVINMNQRILVTVSDKVLSQIKYLCNQIHNVEWSGVLFYNTEGSISDTENFKITLEYIYPMDKGSSGYTEFESDKSIVEFRMNHPETLTMSTGLIHSHNNMDTFFSGTDMKELLENSEFYNIYLSVIVNNKSESVAKIATRAIDKKHELRYTCKDSFNKLFTIATTQNQPTSFIYDCDIDLNTNYNLLDNDFKTKIKELIAKPIQQHTGFNYFNPMSNYNQNVNKQTPNHLFPKKNTPDNQLVIPFPGDNKNFNEDDKLDTEMDVEEFISFMLQLGDIEYDMIDYEEILEDLSTKDFQDIKNYIDSITDNLSSLILRVYPTITDDEIIQLINIIINYLTPYKTQFTYLEYLLQNLNNILKVKNYEQR